MAVKKNRPKNPFLVLLGDVSRRLEPRLSEVLVQSERRGRQHGRATGDLVAAVRHLCERGGKRLRPGLCVVGALCHDAKFDWSPCVDAGVCLELLQAYFLIHDDWMDQDSTRRGGPTAHVELARRFRSNELGEKSAILAGDHAVALASAHLSRLPVSPTRLRKCLHRFAEMQLDAVFGQQLDLLGAAQHPELTYELKTASYTVSGPLLMGAEIAGARPALTNVLASYAKPAGIAFQLRDDLVGVFGSSKVTGKPQGGDLKEGKNTSLVREGRTRLEGRARKNLEKILGNRSASAAEVKAVVRALEDCGARRAVEARITTLMAEANSHLQSPLLSVRGRRLLAGAALALTQRDF